MFSQCEAEERGGFGGDQDGAGGERKGPGGAAGHPGLVGGCGRSSVRDGAERQHQGASGRMLD